VSVAARTRVGWASGWLALLLAISGMASFAAPANASPTVLYDQTDNLYITKINSTDNATTPANTTQVADDFSVPAGHHWAISEVDVDGEFLVGSPGSVNVFLYANAGSGSLPGTQLFAQNNIVATGPNYAVTLTGAPVLDPGTYWISVEANGSDFAYWNWQTRSVQSGNASAWRNPGGGVRPGCTTWGVTSTCLGVVGFYDQAFKLLGVDQHLLTVSEAGTGHGSVTSSPAGVDCGSTCSTSFDAGTVVTLTPTAASGSSFTGWGGDCSGTDACRLTMSADHTVTATFDTKAPGAPNTRITQATIDSGKGVVTFRFRAAGDATGFRCRLHRGHHKAKFRRCRSPKTYTKLKRGTYVFQVKAFGPSGNDPTPAKKRFKID
jgi:Divergent InlB B-repeat domain